MDGVSLYGFKTPCQMQWLKNEQKKLLLIYSYEEELVFYSLCRYMLKKNEGTDARDFHLVTTLDPL